MCPSPDVIQKYLHDDTEFDIKIKTVQGMSYCYKSHLIIEESKKKNARSGSDQ